MHGNLPQRGPSTWRVRVFLGRDETGRKRYLERTVRGTKREVQRVMARLVTEVDDGRHVAAASTRFGEVLDRWLEIKATVVEPTTHQGYRWLADTVEPMSPPAVPALDPVVRLHVLAAALPGAAVAERTLAAPFDQVWRIVTDLETMVARYEPTVEAVEVIDREGERAAVVVTLGSGHRETMQVRIVRGWCLMHSTSTVVAFAARPVGDHTVLAHLEHVRRRSQDPDASQTAGAQRKLERELDAIEALALDRDVR